MLSRPARAEPSRRREASEKRMKRLPILICAVGLAACSGDQDDIRSWMAEQEKGMQGTVKPLPEVKPFPPVEYVPAARVEE